MNKMKLVTVSNPIQPIEAIYFFNIAGISIGFQYASLVKGITKKPSKELSDAIVKFREGRNTALAKKEICNIELESFFKIKGKHFIAGYLTRFGLLAQNSDDVSRTLFYNSKNYIRKLKENNAYRTAIKIWTEYKN